MSIVVAGLNHRSAPVEMREKFAFSDAELPQALESFRSGGIVSEAVILSTCNRVEVYAAGNKPEGQLIDTTVNFLIKSRNIYTQLNGEIYTMGEPDSLIHLFRVASGLDSMVLGETEILGQLKKAYDIALSGKHTGNFLNRSFQRAFNVAKKIRSETNIQKGSISVASVAVELAEKIFETIKSRKVLVIGAGDTAEKSARALASRGASGIVFTNRSIEKARLLASELNGTVIPFEDFIDKISDVDIIISSTSSPEYILNRHKISNAVQKRKNRSLFIVDLAVPRDINPDVTGFENVYLYDIDDLQEIAENYLKQRLADIQNCEKIIREKVGELLRHINSKHG
ncbi:MAG TPA: glutamyl-tRNA reductase [Verrucomicrobiota bacterium]|nr:glutamyl-tRNA reductase [Verrucomicrobiota bacterium]